MAILRFSKEISDIKTTTATTVVRWLSRSPSSSTSMNENDNHYWMYEIPDNESQVATNVVKAASTCYDTYRIWDTATKTSKSSSNDDHPYLWYEQLQCPCSYQNGQNHTFLFYRILYWCKQIILKVGRSYYALPMLLLLSTLGLGILIGYLIGYRRGRYHYHHNQNENHVHQSQQQYPSKETSSSTVFSGAVLPSLVPWYMYVWNLLDRVHIGHLLLLWTTRQQKSETSLEMRDRNSHDTLGDCSIQSTRILFDRSSTQTKDGCSAFATTAVEKKEQIARIELKSDDETQCESGLTQPYCSRNGWKSSIWVTAI